MSTTPGNDPNVSALQDYIVANQLPRSSTHPPAIHHLSLHIAHNLRFQHNWTDVRVHYNVKGGAARTAQALPRPLISGVPPSRLYVHPDEQMEILEQQRSEGKAGWPSEHQREREWVLPSQLHETWTLRRFAEVFDVLPAVPPETDSGPSFGEAEMLTPAGSLSRTASSTPMGAPSDGRSESRAGSSRASPNPWRRKLPKRMLLATLDDDSTVVFYIVHDGLVKPRQN